MCGAGQMVEWMGWWAGEDDNWVAGGWCWMDGWLVGRWVCVCGEG